MSVQTRPLTYDDLCRMPDDGQRYELIGGELYVDRHRCAHTRGW